MPHTHAPIALITFHAGYSHTSLALRSIAAACRSEPFAPALHLFEPQVKAKLEWLLADLVALNPWLIGFSTYLWNIEVTLRMARLLKQLLPDCEIVLGGPEAGPRGEALLQEEPAVDYVIDGEGEHAFRDLVRWRLAQGDGPQGISGLIWRDVLGRSVRNAIDTVPPEALPSPFIDGELPDRPLIYWETSRGCPFRCSFCSSATDRLRALPLARIEADLALIRTLENRTIKLLDRSFHLGARRTTALLEQFIDTPDSIRFHLELNPDRISDDALQLFAQAPPGKFQFEIGLQTLDGAVLERIDRQMEVEKGLATIGKLVALRRHPVHLDLIAGLPGEDAGRFRDSLDRVFRLHPDHLQLGTLKLLPGTPLLAQAEQFGYRWDREPPYEILAHEQLGFAELIRFKQYAELLDRLWNHGLLTHTLMHLVPAYFGDRVSDLLEALLAELGSGLATERVRPELLFARMTQWLAPRLAGDPLLAELHLWDYGVHAPVTAQTPAWIRSQLTTRHAVEVAGHRKQLPRFSLSPAAADLVNRRRLEPLAPGDYALWPDRSRRGQPVSIIPLSASEQLCCGRPT